MLQKKRYFNFGNTIKFDLENISFHYPIDYYKLYFSTAPKYIKKIVDKWENGKELSERDYFQILNKIFSNTYNQLKHQTKTKSGQGSFENGTDNTSLLSLCGLKLHEGKITFIEEIYKETEVKVLLFCLEQFLEPYTRRIVEKYFESYKVNIINWTSNPELESNPLDQVIKSAFLYTLYNYLWLGDENKYNFFIDYFSSEFDKRVSFINRLKENQRPGEGIEYIPIFDDFRNFDPEKGAIIAQMISRVLKKEDILPNEKKLIEEALLNHAKRILNYCDDHATKIRDSILTPVVSELVSLYKSKEFISAAEVCLANKLYNSVLNRSYYAVLRAARAALVNFGHTKPWKGTSLRPSQSHEEVINNFNQFLIYENQIFPKHFCRILKDAYKYRLIADYADQEVDNKTAETILGKAREFVSKVDAVLNQ